MYRAYIENIDELDYNGVPHKGHFVYGNLVRGNYNDDIDAIVGGLIEINDEYVNVEWWQSIEKGSAEQFTGMKDSSGKRIYVGDIVHGYDQEPDRDDGYIGGSVVGVVNFIDGAFRIGKIENRILVETPPIVEIVGNVHDSTLTIIHGGNNEEN